MVYGHAISTTLDPTIWGAVVALDKDHVDIYWMAATLLPEIWSKTGKLKKCGHGMDERKTETYEGQGDA
jgi:hypothetical protein